MHCVLGFGSPHFSLITVDICGMLQPASEDRATAKSCHGIRVTNGKTLAFDGRNPNHPSFSICLRIWQDMNLDETAEQVCTCSTGMSCSMNKSSTTNVTEPKQYVAIDLGWIAHVLSLRQWPQRHSIKQTSCGIASNGFNGMETGAFSLHRFEIPNSDAVASLANLIPWTFYCWFALSKAGEDLASGTLTSCISGLFL